MIESISTPQPSDSIRWRRYPKYKPSGVEWLGEVPEGWEQKRLRFLCSITTGSKNTEDSDPLSEYPFFVRSDKVEHLSSYSFDDEAVITAGDGVGVARVFHHYKGKFDAHQRVYVLTRFKGIKGRFFFYYFKQNLADEVLKLSAKSTVDSLRLPMLQNLPFCVPSLPEQHAIAAFLDRETAHIDALIEKKKRQIELLQEKRSALISHVVTKGLDPNAKMKDSGIEWLGDVPEHWAVMRMASAMKKITNGYVGPTRDIYVVEGIPYLQSLHIKAGKIRFEKEYFVSEEWSKQHEKSILKEGDVLVVQTGAIGETAVVPKEFENTNCHALIILQWRDGLGMGEYLAKLLQSTYGINQLLKEQTGALHPHLECGKIREIPILVPPENEQMEIIHQLNSKLSELDSFIERVQKSMGLLHEFRSALISAAVTGKIDVR